MKIVRIFADSKPILYAIKYEEERTNELDQLLNKLRDPEIIEGFFIDHKADLNQYGNRRYSIEEAVNKTMDSSFKLEQQLFELAEYGYDNPGKYLQTMFEPLHPEDKSLYALQKSKAKPHRKSWIRLYAIRIAEHLYVITGGTIKLIRRMKEREHTLRELQKMNRTVEFLKDQGLLDEQDFERLELGI